jgi:hypothetical protein
VLWLSLGLALVSWPVLYLPWWGLAAFVTMVVPLLGNRATRWAPVAALAALALLIPTAATAIEHDDLFPILVLTAPAVLVLLGTGRPIRRAAVPAFGRLAMVLAVGLLAGGVYSIVTVPILPRTVLEVAGPDPDAANRRIGGHVMAHDDQSTTVLLERGRLETISNDNIRSQVTCLQAARRTYQLEVWGIAVDQSLLTRVARGQLPTAPQDPNCRILIQP